jgi:SAM-dependent methyltransferase
LATEIQMLSDAQQRPAAPASPSRPLPDRRETYASDKPMDQFMVPLLRERIEALLAAYAAPPNQRRALDVGCGGQPFRQRLELLGYRYTGFDVTQNKTGNVDILGVIDGTLPAELLDRAPFDFILCTEVLEHVADWNAAFENLATLLCPGGRLLVTCPAFFPAHETPYDYWRPTAYTLSYYAGRVALRLAHQESAGTPWDVLGTLLGSVWALPRNARFLDRLLARAVNGALQCAFRVLLRRRLQQRVELRGGLHLSNLAVFEKP